MTLLEIEILIYYGVSSGDYRDGDFSAPAVRDAIDKLSDETNQWTVSGMLARASQKATAYYELTDKGRVYLEALKKVPVPVLQWVMPKEAQ